MTDEEIKAAQENTDAVFEYKLKKPLEYNDETYDTLNFDFYKLTGADALNIEDELRAIGKPAFAPALSAEYLIRMSVKACEQPIGADVFEQMTLRDYNGIISRARSFLLSTE